MNSTKSLPRENRHHGPEGDGSRRRPMDLKETPAEIFARTMTDIAGATAVAAGVGMALWIFLK